jgi:hypothetical protein
MYYWHYCGVSSNKGGAIREKAVLGKRFGEKGHKGYCSLTAREFEILVINHMRSIEVVAAKNRSSIEHPRKCLISVFADDLAIQNSYSSFLLVYKRYYSYI